jgi:putative beta-lysine N-acetyltransferase
VGYRQEAFVPRFYNGSLDAAFLGKYLDEERGQDSREGKTREILGIAARKQSQGGTTDAADKPAVESAGVEDAAEMSTVYREVFPTYPFPIHDPGYLLETMRNNVRYFCIRQEGRIVSLSSAEMDRESRNVEMTDFATLPSHRGAGHAVHLLGRMEKEMLHLDIPTSYTIARSMSPGMNITFAKLGYVYAGTLVNNTDISGNIESMNVWYKHLREN